MHNECMDLPLLLSFKERLKWAREAAKMTQPDLAAACGWESQSRISHYEIGRRQPDPEDIKLIAAALQRKGVPATASWLLFGTHKEVQLPSPQDGVVPVPTGQTLLPRVSWVIAGSRAEAVDAYGPGAAEEWIEFDGAASKNAYCLKVRGDSMVRPDGSGFPDGCIIAVEPHRRAKSGDFVVIRFNDSDEATFKQYIVDGPMKLLKPLNPNWTTMQVTPDAHMAGVVFEMRIIKKF